MPPSVLISASVKSLANQPVWVSPSTVVVFLRLANSGLVETLVLVSRLGSWRAISTPSLVEIRSGSITSAPMSMARV